MTATVEVLLCDTCYEVVLDGLRAECQDGCSRRLDHDGACHPLDSDPDQCSRCGTTDRLTPVDVEDLDEEQTARLDLTDTAAPPGAS